MASNGDIPIPPATRTSLLYLAHHYMQMYKINQHNYDVVQSKLIINKNNERINKYYLYYFK